MFDIPIVAHLFWRNDVISAWCILKKIQDNEFWLGIYDEDANDGMCGYNFNKFFIKF